MSIPRKKITLTLVNALPPKTTAWDADIKGFCIRRQNSTAVSYMLKMRVDGRIRWYTFGRHGQPWTPDTARRHALALLNDPSIADKPAELPTQVVFADAAKQFLATHGPKLKPSSLSDYERHIRIYLNPSFGTKALPDISRAHVSTAHAKWSDNPRAANYALAILSKIMTWAEDQGFRPDNTNPCRRVQRYKEGKREYFMQSNELARLGAALDQAEAKNMVGPYSIAALRLLIHTGARRNEILALQWSHVDFERKMLFLPDSKTGQKPIALSTQAVEILQALPRFANNPYVIVGRHGDHLVNLNKPWATIRKLAGLPMVRLHDLRHTYASAAIATGGSLPVLGKILGHSQPQTTARYAHLADDPVRELTQTTGDVLSKALKGQA